MSTATTKKNMPELRFPGFYGEWDIKKLGNLFSRIKTKNTENNQNVLTISAQYGLVNQESFFSKQIASKDITGYTYIEKGDFAYNKSYSKYYPMGAIKRLSKYESGVVSPLYICFKLKNNNRNRSDFYAKYFDAGYINKEIAKIAQEGARNHGLLNMSVEDFFNDIILSNPEEKEQEKIDNFLANVDNWIGNLKTQKEKLEEYKRGMMQKIFSQEVRFKDANGRDFSEWQTVKLGDLFIERTERAEKNSHELLSVTMSNGITRYNSSAKNDGSSKDKSNYKVVRIGDIAYNTMRMWQGASGVSQYEGIVSPAYTVVTPKNGDSDFFAYLFKMPRVIFDFYRYSQGLVSDTWNLKFKHFSEVEVFVPTSVGEQVKIKNFIKSIDDLIYFKSRQIEKAETWKKGLLQKMFI